MPRAILYFEEKDKFLTWSTIVDAPITDLMSEEEYRQWYQIEYGRTGMTGLDEKIKEAKETGCNWRGYTLDDAISGNRAGEDETHATREEIVEMCDPDAR